MKSIINPFVGTLASIGKFLIIFMVLAGSMNLESAAQPLTANFGWDTNFTCMGDTAMFMDSTQFGSPPYTYSWDFGDTGTTDTSSLAFPTHVFSDSGNFNVRLIVTDNLTNVDTIILTINIANCCLIMPNPTQVDESCVGACDGMAFVGPTGGVPPYTYLWDDPGASTNDSAIALCSATYNVTITDSFGCVIFDSVSIYSPLLLVIDSTFGLPAICNSSCDGIANVSTSGGSPPYSFLWDDPGASTTDSALALCAGTYRVTVTDTSGCFLVDSFIVTEPAPLVTASGGGPALCTGSCDGFAFANPSGGIPPLTFLWDDPGVQITDTANGLCAGMYHVTVTDINGCSAIDSFNVADPPILSAAPTSVSASCNGGCDGTAKANPSGGTPPYTFYWDDPGFQTVDSAIGLCALMYHVTITDFNGCSDTDSVQVTEPAPFTASAGADAVICEGSSYTLSGAIGGGATSLTWSTMGTGSFDNPILAAATYTPSAGDIAGGFVQLIITTNDPDGGGPCLAGVDTMLLTIDAAATTGAGLDSTICEGSSYSLFGTLGGSASSITWTTSGTGTFDNPALLGATYTPSPADIAGGTVTLTITTDDPVGLCGPANDFMVLTINSVATASAGADATICEGSNYTLSGIIGGSASNSAWTSSGTGTFDNPSLLAATYTPSPADIAGGTVTLTITTDDPVGPCFAASDFITITINQAAIATAGLDSTICEGATYTMLGTMGGSATSITWTTSGTGTYDNPNLIGAIYTPSAADIAGGTVTLTITSNDPDGAGPCAAASDFMVLTINSVATASAGPDATICEGSNYTLAGTIGGGASTSAWSSSGTGTFDNPSLLAATYTPSPADIAGGTVTLTITTDDPVGPCFAASDFITFTINQAAIVTAGLDSTICEGATYAMLGTMGGSATSITWTTSGTGTYDNPNLVGAIYTPSAADIIGGSVTLTITSNDPDGVGP